jgi:TusA-related sulfurtransferase
MRRFNPGQTLQECLAAALNLETFYEAGRAGGVPRAAVAAFYRDRVEKAQSWEDLQEIALKDVHAHLRLRQPLAQARPALQRELRELNKRLHAWEPSEWFRLNANGSFSVKVAPGVELGALLAQRDQSIIAADVAAFDAAEKRAAPPGAPDQLLDVQGKYCPIPVIEAAKACKQLAAGKVLLVLATDPGVKTDFPDWCKAMKHELLAIEEENKAFRIWIRRS